MTFKRTQVTLIVALFLATIAVSIGKAQQGPQPAKAVQLMGLTGVKDNAKGTLSVENGTLHFTSGKARTEISTANIQDVVTGTDSQKSVGKTVGIVSMAAPYGGGRFLSLFRTKIDTLTVKYRAADGGLHGAIFTMSSGTAEGIKKELLAQGAHTTITGEQTSPSPSSPNKEQKP